MKEGLRELARRESRELTGEGKNQHCVNAGMRQPCEFLILLGDQAQRNLRTQDANRMGVEGDRDGAGMQRARTRNHFPQDSLMSAMHAIEIPNRHHRRTEVGRNFLNGMEDVHGYSSNGTRSPS